MDSNRAGIRPQSPYKQTINVVVPNDDKSKTSQKPCSSFQNVDETVQKPTEPKSGIESQTNERHIFCQNPVHAAARRPAKASRKLPCQHTFCDDCFDRRKSVIGSYVICLKCEQECCLRDIEKIDTRVRKKAETRENVHTKPKEDSRTQEQTRERCDYTKCQQKQVEANETILLCCNHRFCHRCFFKNIKPEITIEEYVCIKCPNCKDDERWYTDSDIKPFIEQGQENYDYYKRFKNAIGSFLNEISCTIDKKNIRLEYKIWGNTDNRDIKIWSVLKQKPCEEFEVPPDKNGLYKVEIPIDGDIYFFKISKRGTNLDMYTKWFGPVNIQQALPPKIEGDIQIKNVSSNSVELSWKVDEGYKHIAVHGISIHKRMKENDGWEECCFVKHPKNRSTVEGLKENTQYTFRLNVVSSVGEAESSHVKTKTKSHLGINEDSEPNAPNAFKIDYTDINEGKFTWKEPSSSFTKKVLEYVLEMKEENGKWKKAGDVRLKLSTPCPFEQMEDGKTYYFRILASNDHGKSKPCELGHPMKKMSLSPPSNFRLEYDAQGCARLIWDTPMVTKSTYKIEYLVEFKEENSKHWIEVTTTRETSILCPHLRMTNGKSYSFQVTAQSTSCKSPPTVLQDCLSKIKDNTIVTAKEKDKENEQELCTGCQEAKLLECCLSCNHKYCLDCSFKLFQTAMECFDGKKPVYMWTCEFDDEMTTESCVQLIGTTLTKAIFQEERKKLQELKPKTKSNSEYSSAEEITTRFRIKGLPNVGMSCFSNCILQILAQTNNFCNHLKKLIRDYALDENTSVTGLLLTVLLEINRESGQDISNRVDYETVVRLMEMICKRDTSFERGEQADSHSFMMALFNLIKEEIEMTEDNRSNKDSKDKSQTNTLDRMNDEQDVNAAQASCFLSRNTIGVLLEKQNKVNKPVPLNQFEGYTTNAFKYEPCHHIEFTEKQMFNSLLIPIKKQFIGNWSVNKGLDVLQEKEIFSGKEVPCEKCNWGQKKTSKFQIFTKLPEVLILQLGKFDATHHFVQKMYETVEYPLRLTLIEDPDLRSEFQWEKTYELYGVTLHSGTIYGGHYTAYVRCKSSEAKTQNDAVWFDCSDSFISIKSEKEVINNSKASVLFYQLISSKRIRA